MATDGPGTPPPPSSPFTGDSFGSSAKNSPDPGRKKKRARKKKSGRSVETGDLQSTDSDASVKSRQPPLAKVGTPPPKKTSGAELEAIKGRSVVKPLGKKEALEVGDLLDAKAAEIKKFHQDNIACFPELKFQSTPKDGYSPASKMLQTQMKQLKQLLDEHQELLDKNYRVIAQNEPQCKRLEKQLHAKIGFRSSVASKELAELAEVAQKDKLDQRYWRQRTICSLYRDLCNQQYSACNVMLNQLRAIQSHVDIQERIGEIISASLQCSKVNSELMLCWKMLGKTEEMEACRESVIKPGLLVLLALDVGMKHYFFGNHSKLRDALNDFNQYYRGWIEQYDPVTDRTLDKKSTVIMGLICACLVMDQPGQGIRFAQYFLEQVRRDEYDFNNVFMLIYQIMTAYPFLYGNFPEDNFAEKEKRIRDAELLLDEIRSIVRHAVDHNPEELDQAQSMILLFNGIENELRFHKAQVLARYEQAEAVGNQLITEEDEQARKIQERLLKREEKRKKKEAKRLEALEAKKKAEESQPPSKKEGASEQEVTPIAEASVKLHPAIAAGIAAYTSRKPLADVQREFKQIEGDPKASLFDKVQAKYGLADVVAASLKKRLEAYKRMIEAVQQYDSELRKNELPSVEVDMAFRKALNTYASGIVDLNADTLRMSLAFKQAWEQFFEQEELQDDFIERLVELQDEMKRLIADGEEVARCCATIPNIYSRRGDMLRAYGIKGKGDPERRKTTTEHIQALEKDSARVNSSFANLKRTIDIDLLNKASRSNPVMDDVPDVVVGVGPNAIVSELSVPTPETVSSPTQSVTSVGASYADVVASVEVISLPVLPAPLAAEIQKKTGRALSASSFSSEASVETIGFTDAQWLPDSDCDPHPLTLIAQHLNTPIEVTVRQKRWYVAPGAKPVDADSVVKSKKMIKLEYAFTEGNEVESVPDTSSQIPPESVATATPIASTQPPQRLPLQSLLPDDIANALMRSIQDTGQEWLSGREGLSKKQAKAAKKVKTTQKRKHKGAALAQLPDEPEEPKLTVLSLQGMLRRKLHYIMNSDEYKKAPSTSNLRVIVQRACEGRLFKEPHAKHQDFKLLSWALNIPLHVAYRINEVTCYHPDMSPPTELSIHGQVEGDHLTLESYSSGSKDFWFASLQHYYDWGDDMDDAETEKREQTKSEKKKSPASRVKK